MQILIILQIFFFLDSPKDFFGLGLIHAVRFVLVSLKPRKLNEWHVFKTSNYL